MRSNKTCWRSSLSSAFKNAGLDEPLDDFVGKWQDVFGMGVFEDSRRLLKTEICKSGAPTHDCRKENRTLICEMSKCFWKNPKLKSATEFGRI